MIQISFVPLVADEREQIRQLDRATVAIQVARALGFTVSARMAQGDRALEVQIVADDRAPTSGFRLVQGDLDVLRQLPSLVPDGAGLGDDPNGAREWLYKFVERFAETFGCEPPYPNRPKR